MAAATATATVPAPPKEFTRLDRDDVPSSRCGRSETNGNSIGCCLHLAEYLMSQTHSRKLTLGGMLIRPPCESQITPHTYEAASARVPAASDDAAPVELRRRVFFFFFFFCAGGTRRTGSPSVGGVFVRDAALGTTYLDETEFTKGLCSNCAKVSILVEASE